jgi:hypothetical protein
MAGKNMDAQRRSDGEHKKTYSIGDLAREFGISLRTPRFYEDRGLLIPIAREPSGIPGFASSISRAFSRWNL